MPHRVPVKVDGGALVGEGQIKKRPEWIGHELEAAAPVVERVDRDGGAGILKEPAVPPHLVGHDPFRVAIPASRRDIEILVVKEDPSVRAGLAGGDVCLLRSQRGRRSRNELRAVSVDSALKHSPRG